MGEPERWQQGDEEFVLEQVGDPPARVLEVGCGEGATVGEEPEVEVALL